MMPTRVEGAAARAIHVVVIGRSAKPDPSSICRRFMSLIPIFPVPPDITNPMT